MVVCSLTDAAPLQSLLLAETGEDTQDDRSVRVEPDPHETMAAGLGDVLKVHRTALDEGTDGDDGVKGFTQPFCRLDFALTTTAFCLEARIVQECGRTRHEVTTSLSSLGLSRRDEPGSAHGQLPATGHALDDDVLELDTGFGQGGDGARDQGLDALGVPAGVDDADSERWSCGEAVRGRRGAFEGEAS